MSIRFSNSSYVSANQTFSDSDLTPNTAVNGDFRSDLRSVQMAELSDLKQKANRSAGDILREDLIRVPIRANLNQEREVVLNFTKPYEEMSRDDYDLAYLRSLAKVTGHNDLSDNQLRELNAAIGEVRTETLGLAGNLEELHLYHSQHNKRTTSVCEFNRMLFDRAARAVKAREGAEIEFREAAKRIGTAEANEMLKDWGKLHANVGINLINGATEPFRAIAERAGLDTAPVRRFQLNSELWNKNMNGQLTEVAGTVFAGVMAAPHILKSRAGQIFSLGEGGYHVAAGINGEDITEKDENGNPRQMGKWERGLRIVGGGLGMVGAARELSNIKLPSLKPPMPGTVAEAVSPDGIKLRVNSEILDTLPSGNHINADMISADSSLNKLNSIPVKGAGEWKFNPKVDIDWRGKGKTFLQGLEEAFSRTGTPRNEFIITKWGKDKLGKSFPVEYRAKNGAEVNIDIPHKLDGPAEPHIGYQTPGKRSAGGAVRGHIIMDEVPVNRISIKE